MAFLRYDIPDYRSDKNLVHTLQVNSPTYKITVNKASHTLTLYKNNAPYRNYPAAIGKPSTPTPPGTYKIINKATNPGGPFGVRWMGLNIPGGGFGIHGTNNPGSIGKSVSHGCIRLNNKDVTELYQLVPIGTSVTIV